MFRVLFSISALRFYCAEWEFDTLTRKRRYLTTRRQVSESRKRYSAAKRGNVLHKGALGLCCGDGGRDCVECASRRICEGSEVRLRSRFWQEITVTAQTDFWSAEIRSDPNKVAVQSAANIIYQHPSWIWVWFYWMFDMTPYTTWHQFRTLALLIRVIAERLFVVLHLRTTSEQCDPNSHSLVLPSPAQLHGRQHFFAIKRKREQNSETSETF